jgi:hypothetical protein
MIPPKFLWWKFKQQKMIKMGERSPVEIKTLPQAQITIFIGGINHSRGLYIIVLPTLL